MARKFIGELKGADSLDSGDLILGRKKIFNTDFAITKENFFSSLRVNPAINGMRVANFDEEARTIDLEFVSSAKIEAYIEDMVISFISPFSATGAQIKINDLDYVTLQDLLLRNELVKTKFINDKFHILDCPSRGFYIRYTNEYIASGEILEDDSGNPYTRYKLSSAIGQKKPYYYEGMSAQFVTPVDSRGAVFINIDELGDVPIGDGEQAFLINDDFYEGRLIKLIYKNGTFLKFHQPNVIEQAPIGNNQDLNIPELEEIEENITDTVNTQDIDPAGADSPYALAHDGRRIFKSVIKINYLSDLDRVIPALINRVGDDGGGKYYAIEIQNTVNPNSIPETVNLRLNQINRNFDLSWIAIFLKDADNVARGRQFYSIKLPKDFLGTIFNIRSIKIFPIFNFELKLTPSGSDSPSPKCNIFSSINAESLLETLIFGKYGAIRSDRYVTIGAIAQNIIAKYSSGLGDIALEEYQNNTILKEWNKSPYIFSTNQHIFNADFKDMFLNLDTGRPSSGGSFDTVILRGSFTNTKIANAYQWNSSGIFTRTDYPSTVGFKTYVIGTYQKPTRLDNIKLISGGERYYNPGGSEPKKYLIANCIPTYIQGFVIIKNTIFTKDYNENYFGDYVPYNELPPLHGTEILDPPFSELSLGTKVVFENCEFKSIKFPINNPDQKRKSLGAYSIIANRATSSISELIFRNCRFHPLEGYTYHVGVYGNQNTKIILDNTEGVITNQPIGTQTDKGIIVEANT